MDDHRPHDQIKAEVMSLAASINFIPLPARHGAESPVEAGRNGWGAWTSAATMPAVIEMIARLRALGAK